MTVTSIDENPHAVVGHLRTLRVEGAWNQSCLQMFNEESCNALEWSAPPESRLTCDHLRELSPALQSLSITASKPVDDSAIPDLHGLRFLSAMTRATNPLDLSPLRGLEILYIDDREGLVGFDLPSLKLASVYRSRRTLADFEGAVALETLTLEGRKSDLLHLRGTHHRLRVLRIAGSGVLSLEGLRVPSLENLYLESASRPHELDLAPLRSLPKLRVLVVRGPKRVHNGHLLKQEFELLITPAGRPGR